KTEFLQRMSHDIRTPINGIRGMVEIGDRCPEDMARQADCRKKIWEASTLLLELVNEVLDMGKLESGEVVLENVPFRSARADARDHGRAGKTGGRARYCAAPGIRQAAASPAGGQPAARQAAADECAQQCHQV
ncbi:MAG: histidine kinase dimerization/phospho-acceptor domain-containing protein, partial [Faecalibacterium prausnitzii]